MRRWFLAAFTLHFCFSVVCFSIGHLHADEVRGSAGGAHTMEAYADEMLELIAQLDEDGHHLLEGHVDVQEIIHDDDVLRRFSAPSSPPDAFTSPERAPPTLAGLHRPPIPRIAA